MRWLRDLRFSGVPGRMARRLASVVLLALSMTLFFGGLAARQLTLAEGGTEDRANVLFVGGIVLALLAVAASGTLRRPWGVSLGWVVMALTALSTLLLPAMAIVTVVFGALWVFALVQGDRMDALTQEWIAEHGDVHPEDRADGGEQGGDQQNPHKNGGHGNETTTKMGEDD